jgi:hypothetical protein
MDIPITRDQLNNCTQLKKIYEEKEYQKELNKYINDVVESVTKEIIFRLNPHRNGDKKYVYNIGKSNIPNHPYLPPLLTKNLKNIYTNDIENIYPINDMIIGLTKKFPDCKIFLNNEKTSITIDWSN